MSQTGSAQSPRGAPACVGRGGGLGVVDESKRTLVSLVEPLGASLARRDVPPIARRQSVERGFEQVGGDGGHRAVAAVSRPVRVVAVAVQVAGAGDDADRSARHREAEPEAPGVERTGLLGIAARGLERRAGKQHVAPASGDVGAAQVVGQRGVTFGVGLAVRDGAIGVAVLEEPQLAEADDVEVSCRLCSSQGSHAVGRQQVVAVEAEQHVVPGVGDRRVPGRRAAAVDYVMHGNHRVVLLGELVDQLRRGVRSRRRPPARSRRLRGGSSPGSN